MTETTEQYYKVAWKFKQPKAKMQTKDLLMPSVWETLRLMDKSEGVNPSTTECLYVHLIKNGVPHEVFAHEEVKGTTGNKKVVSLEDVRNRKPRMRLVSPDAPSSPLTDAPKDNGTSIMFGLYKVYEAR